MTAKECIDQLMSSNPFMIGCRDIDKYNDYINSLLELLEKQIPRVPIDKTKPDNGVCQKYENCNIVICPSCERRLKLKSKGNYCDKCGQALKWE